jgi:hypothetical protein
MDAKLKSKAHCTKAVLIFLSRFVRVWLRSLQKSYKKSPNFFSLTIIPYGIKNAEFFSDFEFAEMLGNSYRNMLLGLELFSSVLKDEKQQIRSLLC